MIKNTASQTVSFQMISKTDGSDVTSGSPAVYVCGDGGSQAAGSGTITHEGNGCWSYAVSAADSNFSHVSFTMVLSGALSQTVNVYPITLADYKADVSGIASILVSGFASILEDTGTMIPGLIAALNNISVSNIIAGISDGTFNLQEMIRIMFSVLSGKTSGGGTNTLNFRDSGDTKNRVIATVDVNGNRTGITLDGS